MSHLPIRGRLTLAFVAVMTAVLSGAGFFLYLSFGSDLDKTTNQGLYTRATDVSALIQEADSGLQSSGGGRLAEEGENFAQILTPDRRVFDATPQFDKSPLLHPDETARALRGTIIVDHEQERDREPVRILATPVTAQGKRLVVVVGTPLEDRREALQNLRGLLLIGGSLALLLASVAGYLVAAAALRPVESMRRRAATISGDDPGVRLPIPASNDEISRLGETLNAMLTRLELAVTHERDFVSDASHELRTPLAILRTEIELALRRGRSATELEAALKSVAGEVDRLVQLSDGLLVLARLDQGRMPVKREQIGVRNFLTQITGGYAGRFLDQGRSISVNAPSDLEVNVDPIRFEQVITNLLENTLRHGGGTVVVDVQTDWDSVTIGVSDEGEGFPPTFLPRAFDRFSRASESRQNAGSGLGLAIVSAIVDSHGGSVTAINRPSGGARVEIKIPRCLTPGAGPHKP